MRMVRFVHVFPLVAAALGAAALGGCEQQPLETRAVNAATESDATPLDQIAAEGAIDCPIVCVSEVAKDARAHAGRVAVRGVVSKVFADRRAFTVVNIVEGATCCASGCGNDTIAARVPSDLYAGEMPEQFQRVILVGEIVPNGDGYEFVIEQVWAGGSVVLKRAGA